MEAQKPLEQETPETTPQEVPTATIPQPESTPAANMEADPIPEEMDASPESPTKKTAGKLAALIGGGAGHILSGFVHRLRQPRHHPRPHRRDGRGYERIDRPAGAGALAAEGTGRMSGDSAAPDVGR